MVCNAKERGIRKECQKMLMKEQMKRKKHLCRGAEIYLIILSSSRRKKIGQRGGVKSRTGM